MQRLITGVIAITLAALLAACGDSWDPPDMSGLQASAANGSRTDAPADRPSEPAPVVEPALPGPSISSPDDVRAVAPPDQTGLPARFGGRSTSRDVRGNDGWFIYARRDADTGQVIELIIANRHATAIRREGSMERVIFKTEGGGERAFAGNSYMLAMLKFTGDRMQMRIESLPRLSGDPVLAYRRALERTPTLSVRDFLATAGMLDPIEDLRPFFELE